MNDILTERDFVTVGHTSGLHGYDGTVQLNADSRISDLLGVDITFVYFIEEGMYVPRFIRSWDSEQSLISFDRINIREEARILTDRDIYLRKRDLPASVSVSQDSNMDWDGLSGFQIWDVESDQMMGMISAIEEYPGGWMAVIIRGNRTVLIPLAEPLVDHIDEKNQILYMDLPEGLDEI